MPVSEGAHCCNTGKPCQDSSPAEESSQPCVFVAHPFDDATLEWAKLLKEQLGEFVEVQLPDAQRSTGVVFCRLCNQIRSSTAIISEISDLNRNVIFEHGFAIATGCRGILIKKRGRTGSPGLSVLRDIVQRDYENLDEVVEHVVDLTEAGLSKQKDADGTPLFMGEWSFADIRRDYKSICFLRLGQPNSDAIKRIQRVLRDSPFEITAIDPEEYATHQLHDFCKKIFQSYAVVGHFVNETRVTHKQDNALTALLLGIALGAGRPILVLQELPVNKPMIDLKGVLHDYTTLKSLQEKLEERLSIWHEAASALESRWTTATRDDATRAAALDIGSAAAETDKLLDQAFYLHPSTAWVTSASKFIIAGPKGAGKTALFQHARFRNTNTNKRKFLFFEPTSLEMQRIRDFALLDASEANLDHLCRSLWRFNMLAECVRTIIDEASPLDLSDPDMTKLQAAYHALDIDEDADFAERYISFLTKRQSESSKPLNNAIAEARLTQLEACLARVIEGYELYAYADRLDEGWEANDALSRSLVRAFVHECFSLKLAYGKSFHPTIFLLVEILDAVRQGLPEADKWDIAELTWTRDELKQLLQRRLETAMKQAGHLSGAVAWDAILPHQFDGQDSADYLLDRTLLRPRDAIRLFQIVVETAHRRAGLPASEDNVRTSLRTFASERLLNLAIEHTTEYPGLQGIVEQLAGKFDDSFCVAERALDESLRELTRDLSGAWASIDEPIRALYEVGVVVYRTSYNSLIRYPTVEFLEAHRIAKTQKVLESEPRIRALPKFLPKRTMTEERIVCLHPAFHGLKEAFSHAVDFHE